MATGPTLVEIQKLLGAFSFLGFEKAHATEQERSSTPHANRSHLVCLVVEPFGTSYTLRFCVSAAFGDAILNTKLQFGVKKLRGVVSDYLYESAQLWTAGDDAVKVHLHQNNIDREVEVKLGPTEGWRIWTENFY